MDVVADRFRLLGAVGRGNMGEVHRAEDLAAADGAEHRVVAVKLVLRSRSGAAIDSLTERKVVQRFDREVRIMRRLDHPHLPKIIAGGVDARGLPYLAMEFLDGDTLRDLGAEQPRLPIAWVAALGVQIANGLAAAHAAGVVHRDLKPANVMLLPGGLVKLLDFGMGRIVDDPDGGRVTSSGATVGTARYMAPEQFHGAAVTQAADLYALGCVLFELLTGAPVFPDESAHALGQQHCTEPAPPVRVIRPDVPEDLAQLIHQLLAKDPADRPADAVFVREALRPLATGVAGVARVPGWEERDPVGYLTRARAGTGPGPAGAAAHRPGTAPATPPGPRRIRRIQRSV